MTKTFAPAKNGFEKEHQNASTAKSIVPVNGNIRA